MLQCIKHLEQGSVFIISLAKPSSGYHTHLPFNINYLSSLLPILQQATYSFPCGFAHTEKKKVLITEILRNSHCRACNILWQTDTLSLVMPSTFNLLDHRGKRYRM